MSQGSLSRVRVAVVLAGISVVASIAMVIGVWGSGTWGPDGFGTACIVTALVAVAGGLLIVPLLSRLAARDDDR